MNPGLLLFLSALASAKAAGTLAPECALAGLKAVTFQEGKLSSPQDRQNFCESYDSEREAIAQDLRGHLVRIAEIHLKAEQVTGHTFSAVLSQGLHVHFRGDVAGPYLSHYLPAEASEIGLPSLTLGIFSSLLSEMNAGIYTHELGHAIFDGLIRGGHPLERLGSHVTLNEFLADLLAWSIHGAVFTSDGGLRGCFLNDRNYRQMLSYRGPALRFSIALPSRSLERCCQLTRNQAELTREEAGVCRKIQNPNSMEWARRIEEKFRHVTLQQVAQAAPDDFQELRKHLDPHQIGLPWLTWMVDLARANGAVPYVFFETFFRERLPEMTQQTSCEVRNRDELKKTFIVQHPSMSLLLNEILEHYPEQRDAAARRLFFEGAKVADQLEARSEAQRFYDRSRDDPELEGCFRLNLPCKIRCFTDPRNSTREEEDPERGEPLPDHRSVASRLR